MTAEDRAFWQGFAVALRDVADMEASHAADIAVRNGASLAIFKQARVPSSDIAPFRAELRRKESAARTAGAL